MNYKINIKYNENEQSEQTDINKIIEDILIRKLNDFFIRNNCKNE